MTLTTQHHNHGARLLAVIAVLAALVAVVPQSARAITLGSSAGTWTPVVCENRASPPYPVQQLISDCVVIFQPVGPNGDTTIRWGSPTNSGQKSGLGYKGFTDVVVTPGANFDIGTLYHYNYPVYGSLSKARLAIGLTFSDPAGLASTQTFTFDIDETPNSGICEYPSTTPCADAISFPSTFSQETFATGDRKYALQMVGFQYGGQIVPRLISNEEQVTSAVLVARIVDVTPTVTIDTPAAGAIVQTNSPVSVSATITDPADDGNDTHTCSIDWNNDGTPDAAGAVVDGGASEVCTAQYPGYASPGLVTIAVTIADNEGGTASDTVQIDVNAAPIVAANSPSVTVDEGSSAAMSGTVADLDPVTLTASIGTVMNNGDGTWSWSATPADGPATTAVTVTADDGRGGIGTTTFDLIVNNVAPSVTITTPTEGQLFSNGATVAVSATVSDPGVNDTHSCSIDFGAGAQPGTMTAGVCSGSGQLSLPGVYTITVVATDTDGASGQASVMVVVYGEGSVSGGGWIDSPAGAYAADPSLSGKASFGFTSQYKKGATVPTGTSHFQFHAGGLSVQSIAYDWLVVNQGNTNAQFKGTATVNGAATNAAGDPYRFMIWAGDGAPDTFRIRVWTESGGSETVVYDNGVNQPLGGGAIVIQKPK